MSRPYGIVIFGLASIGSRSFRDLFSEFDASIGTGNPPVSEVARRLHVFLVSAWRNEATRNRRNPDELPEAGVFVGGCGDGESHCSFSSIRLAATGNDAIVDYEAAGGFLFEGRPVAVHRLIYGADPEILAAALLIRA